MQTFMGRGGIGARSENAGPERDRIKDIGDPVTPRGNAALPARMPLMRVPPLRRPPVPYHYADEPQQRAKSGRLLPSELVF